MNGRKWSLGPIATINFSLVLIVLILNSLVVHRNTLGLHAGQVHINRTYEMLLHSQTLLSTLKDADGDARGYALTGDASLLKSYEAAAAKVPLDVTLLRTAISDDQRQTVLVDEMASRINQQMSRLRAIADMRTATNAEPDRATISSIEDKEAWASIARTVTELQIERNQQLSVYTLDQNNSLFVVLSANLAAVVVGAAITVVAWMLVERELRKRRQAESAAHSERQNLWVTLTSIGDGVIVADATGIVKLANPVSQVLMGHPRNVIGRPFAEVVSITDEATQTSLENPVSQVLARTRGNGFAGHNILRQTDGSVIPIEHTASPIRDDEGRITGVVFVFRDVSERRRYEKEMNERERRFRRVFETPLIGIAIGSSRGAILEANDAFLELIGYRRAELDKASLNWKGTPREQSPLNEAAKRELNENGVCRPFERTFSRPDGADIPVLISAARLMDDRDQIVIFITDLSQSKRAEAAFRESEARFRILSECMPQKVWTAKPDGQWDYLNHMLLEYAGLPVEQLLGWGWTNLIHPDDLSNQLRAWNESLATGNMLEIEHRVRKHNGEYRWHLARALPMYNTDSQIAMWVGTNTDIHDQKQAEEALREEHHRKDRFLALLAHELRNPLAPLSNAIQVFPSVQNDPANSAALFGIMQRQVRQMTRLIDDLLDLARITTGRMRLRRERVVVGTVVAAAIESVQPLISERQHRFTTSVPAEELWLDADPARLAQILTNLIHNAAKYTNPRGELSLVVERVGTYVLFRVRDNGPGISKEMLAKIFDLFTQAELTLDRAHGGLGIGLTLVRTLVELHGGEVSATSPGLGHGSEFVVRLPLLDSPAPEVNEQPPPRPLPTLKVLVVDDVQASARTLALMLKTLGQNVEVEFDGSSAIARATAEDFDLIFLDIAMPGMSGLEAARQMRSIPVLADVMLIALTGFGQEEDRAHSLEAGFNEHLIKPTSLDALRDMLLVAADRQNKSDL
ncbi:PAS domain S-box protein [Schlesneria paludicola]|uniref:PAS domain S-box protein n=1 Tax=Schlesneria paludicola TaxID=360056 RepID=UPI000313BAB4|nr:PAS domain S-box protein [Schlesneria paludicola]